MGFQPRILADNRVAPKCIICIKVHILFQNACFALKYEGIVESNASTSPTREVVGIKTRSQSRLIAYSVWN